MSQEDELREALESMCCQFAFWRDGCGLWTNGLSALEDAFSALGWSDPYPCPELRCDEPGCGKRGTCGFPAPKTEVHPKGYRRTCSEHYKSEGKP